MRFKEIKESEPANRNHTWFAIWPVTIKGETRWLEKVTVYQRLVTRDWMDYGGLITEYENVHFVDKDTQ